MKNENKGEANSKEVKEKKIISSLTDDNVNKIKESIRVSGGDWNEGCEYAGYWLNGRSLIFTNNCIDKPSKDAFCISRNCLEKIIKELPEHDNKDKKLKEIQEDVNAKDVKEIPKATKESSVRRIIIETDGNIITNVNAQVNGSIELIAILEEVIGTLKNAQIERAKEVQASFRAKEEKK